MCACRPVLRIPTSIIKIPLWPRTRALQSRISFPKSFRLLTGHGRRIFTATVSDSLPPTPPSRAPNDDERRFETISSPCEWIEDYHPGGYHPVHLRDVFHDGQYKILRALGDGSFSTAWLARDLKKNTYVALKILVSEISESTRELQIIRYIGKEAPDDGNRYITQLLDEFQHHGPNGVHICLVAKRPSTADILRDPWFSESNLSL